MTIQEAIDFGTQVLKNNEVIEPRRESALLLSLAIQKDKAFLIAHPEDILEPSDLKTFRGYIERRAAHEPFQYISGHQEFFRHDFCVTPAVLIPRPETELLVEAAIDFLTDRSRPSFCEIGVGSGCIAISILLGVENSSAMAVDISERAIEIARKNAERLAVADRLVLLTSDVFDAIEPHRFHLVVSNPPYVPLADIETLQPEVRDFEPHSSLTDGENGLSIIRRLVAESPALLRPGGGLLIEIGFNQGDAVREMFDERIWKQVLILPDLQGIPRIVNARLR